nr:hypothetical protein [Bacillus thuringiensis]
MKSIIWLFSIIGLIYACEFFYGLMFHQEFHWIKLVLITIMFIGCLDIKKNIRNNDYRTA